MTPILENSTNIIDIKNTKKLVREIQEIVKNDIENILNILLVLEDARQICIIELYQFHDETLNFIEKINKINNNILKIIKHGMNENSVEYIVYKDNSSFHWFIQIYLNKKPKDFLKVFLYDNIQMDSILMGTYLGYLYPYVGSIDRNFTIQFLIKDMNFKNRKKRSLYGQNGTTKLKINLKYLLDNQTKMFNDILNKYNFEISYKIKK